jgi:outer membrane protein assembly factor BamB
VLTCLNTADGKTRWQNRLKGNFIASPVHVDGKIFFCSREGETTVIRPGLTYDEVVVNILPDQLMASPVVIGNALLLRTESHLYKIQKPKPTTQTTRKPS